MIYLTVFLLIYVPYETFVHFAALERLKAVESKLTTEMTKLSKVLLAYGYFLDFAFNAVHGSIMFLEIPQELLFTTRVERHLAHGWAWQRRLAAWWCLRLGIIDVTGTHCKER